MAAENGGTALGRMAGQDSNDPPAGISQPMSLSESSLKAATLIMPRATLIPAFAQGEKDVGESLIHAKLCREKILHLLFAGCCAPPCSRSG